MCHINKETPRDTGVPSLCATQVYGYNEINGRTEKLTNVRHLVGISRFLWSDAYGFHLTHDISDVHSATTVAFNKTFGFNFVKVTRPNMRFF